MCWSIAEAGLAVKTLRIICNLGMVLEGVAQERVVIVQVGWQREVVPDVVVGYRTVFRSEVVDGICDLGGDLGTIATVDRLGEAGAIGKIRPLALEIGCVGCG